MVDGDIRGALIEIGYRVATCKHERRDQFVGFRDCGLRMIDEAGLDHIVVSGAGGNGSGATVGTGSSSGGGIDLGSAPPDGGTLGDTTGFGAPQDLMDNLVNDYVPTGYCVFFGTSDCAYYFRDEVNQENSGFYGLWGSEANQTMIKDYLFRIPKVTCAKHG